MVVGSLAENAEARGQLDHDGLVGAADPDQVAGRSCALISGAFAVSGPHGHRLADWRSQADRFLNAAVARPPTEQDLNARLTAATAGETMDRNSLKGAAMSASSPCSILVVAHKTAATRALHDAVRERAARGPARFHLLVPNPGLGGWRPSETHHPDVTEGEQVLALALPLIERAAGAPATGSVSPRHDPMDAIEEALHDGSYDEIILSTLPRSVSRWLHVDLPRRVAHLGLPVTTVIATDREAVGVN